MAVAVLSSMPRKRVFSDDLFFDDDDPLPLHKRIRSSSSDHQFLEAVLDACGGDNLDSDVKSCNTRRSGDESIFSSEVDGDVSLSTEANVVNPPGGGGSFVKANLVNLSSDGPEWLDLLVGEMMHASNVNDARLRASRVLELLEKSMIHAGGKVSKENTKLREREETLLRDNVILKRAVVIQHKRQKDYDVKNQELQQINQLLMEYQEKLKTVELNNYALAMHLKQAQQNCSIVGRFHHDVF